MKLTSTDTGKAVAAVLNRSWRAFPPPLEVSREELDLATERLLATGAGALGWCRVRHSSLQTTSAAQQLQDAYRLHSLQDLQHEREIETVLTWLANIDAVVRESDPSGNTGEGRKARLAFRETGLILSRVP